MIERKNLPLVKVESMNEVHFEEIELINGLLAKLDDEADFETLADAFEQIIEHMQSHFANEEQMMKEAHYPTFRLHKSDHDKILNEARYVYMDWRTQKDNQALRSYFEEDIAQWLEQHIKAMDTPTAEFIAERMST